MLSQCRSAKMELMHVLRRTVVLLSELGDERRPNNNQKEKTSGLLGSHKNISGEKTFQLKGALSFVDAQLSLHPEKTSCMDFSERFKIRFCG